MDLLRRWQPIMVKCSNSQSSCERPILSQMFVETVCMPKCLIYTTVAMEVIGTPEFNDLEGCPNAFGNIVYVQNVY